MRFLTSLPLYLGLGLLASSLPLTAEAGSTQSYKVELNKTEIVRSLLEIQTLPMSPYSPVILSLLLVEDMAKRTSSS